MPIDWAGLDQRLRELMVTWYSGPHSDAAFSHMYRLIIEVEKNRIVAELRGVTAPQIEPLIVRQIYEAIQ